MNIPTKVIVLSLTLMSSIVSHPVVADRGKEIFDAANKKDDGFGNTDEIQELLIINAQGKETRRVMRLIRLEGSGEVGEKTLRVFRKPKDSKGTALLTHGMIDKDDSQWMYLPNLKRIKRIASAAKTSRFSGSEFTFEDLAIQDLNDYSYHFVRETEYGGVAVFEVELTPLDTKSGYSKLVTWLNQDNLNVLKINYYNKKNKFSKTLTFENYQLYNDKYWRAHITRMVNHLTDTESTVSVLGDVAFQTGLSEKDFSKSRLKNIR